ncbi:MAG: peptidoglycan DD-metalloendopeptidase family protein [Wenzhouxiangellaceae bacterium]
MLAAIIALPAAAKRIYQFTDEQGIVHITDVPPETEQPVTSRPVKVDTKGPLAVYQTGIEHRFPQRFQNRLYGPLEVEVKLVEAENIHSDPPLPGRFVLEPQYFGDLLQFRPADPRRGYRLQISYRAVPGAPGVVHDQQARYLPPVPARQRFRISQGFNGGQTHTTPDSRYAVDIPMDEGTPVVAARSGIVMDVQDDFYEGGADLERYGQRANRVIILHSDGTMAVYAHLAPESAYARPGQTVLAGEMVGRSGNTGYSTGPHLHFAIQRNAGMRLESVPFYFRAENGADILPESGAVLVGYKPGVE